MRRGERKFLSAYNLRRERTALRNGVGGWTETRRETANSRWLISHTYGCPPPFSVDRKWGLRGMAQQWLWVAKKLQFLYFGAIFNILLIWL
jgi:hypothetical protein